MAKALLRDLRMNATGEKLGRVAVPQIGAIPDEAVRGSGGSFIFVCKPASHKTPQDDLTGVEIDSISETKGIGSAKHV